MISEFNRFFKKQSLASTYKPTFVKCLLDLGDYEKYEGGNWVEEKQDEVIVDLNFIAVRFLRLYHPLKFKFKLKQEATKKTIAVYRILEEFEKQIGKKTTPSKKSLCSKDFEEIRKKTINEGIKPQVLKKLLNDCKIYKINKGSNSIVIKKEIIHFMNKNKKLLESALNHMIARYLENCNMSPNISTKLEEKIPQKKLKTQEFNEIVSLQKSRCFYCEKKFDSFAQEHFLPWNWVWQTENFNIVPACTNCNSSKHDKLPEEKFLKKLLERNKKLDNLPIGYSDKFLETQYENCRTGYHGIDQELWKLA